VAGKSSIISAHGSIHEYAISHGKLRTKDPLAAQWFYFYAFSNSEKLGMRSDVPPLLSSTHTHEKAKNGSP